MSIGKALVIMDQFDHCVGSGFMPREIQKQLDAIGGKFVYLGALEGSDRVLYPCHYQYRRKRF